MTRLALFLTFALALAVPSVKAQQFGPTVRVNLIDESTGRKVKMDLPAPKHAFDASYLKWAAISHFTATADAELTAFNVGAGRQEWNPIYGRRPSHARVEFTTQIVALGIDYIGYRMKRKQEAVQAFGGKVDWTNDYRIPFIGSITWHGVGFVVGMAR